MKRYVKRYVIQFTAKMVGCDSTSGYPVVTEMLQDLGKVRTTELPSGLISFPKNRGIIPLSTQKIL